ncbi:MAG TPA: hypothetical protein VJZ04_02150 [Lachnospiraceae bacterium]|nr:hypothetical protein [Lachnospiraceae bacterium]
MWVNKKKTLFLFAFLILTVTSLTSCGKKALFNSTSKSNDSKETTLLNNSTKDSPNTYKTSEVFIGDFTNTIQLKGSSYLTIPTNVFCKVEHGTMIFDEFKVKRWDFVSKGDTLAIVHMDVDLIDIEEKKLNLKRKKEHLATLEAKTEASLKEYIEFLYTLESGLEKSKDKLIYEQMCADWDYQKSQLTKECEDLFDDIQILQAALNVTTIISPVDGIVMELTGIASGSTLNDNRILVSIASYDDFVVSVDNTGGQFLTGMPVTVETSTDKGIVTSTGTVISSSKNCVSSEFPTDIAQIKLDTDDISFYMGNSLTVYAEIRAFQNVLLVDRNAVTLENEKAYLTVLDENGAFIKKYFRFAASNSSYYFILKDIGEGTTVITE